MKAKFGNLTEVAKALDVSRTSVHDWINKDKRFKLIQEEAREALIDFTESQAKILMTGIPKYEPDPNDPTKKVFVGWKERPDTTLLLWTQKTLGKDRGYVERSEVTGKNGERLLPEQKIDVSKLPDDVLDKLIELSQSKGK